MASSAQSIKEIQRELESTGFVIKEASRARQAKAKGKSKQLQPKLVEEHSTTSEVESNGTAKTSATTGDAQLHATKISATGNPDQASNTPVDDADDIVVMPRGMKGVAAVDADIPSVAPALPGALSALSKPYVPLFMQQQQHQVHQHHHHHPHPSGFSSHHGNHHSFHHQLHHFQRQPQQRMNQSSEDYYESLTHATHLRMQQEQQSHFAGTRLYQQSSYTENLAHYSGGAVGAMVDDFETDPDAYYDGMEDDGLFEYADDELDDDEEAWVLEQMIEADEMRKVAEGVGSA